MLLFLCLCVRYEQKVMDIVEIGSSGMCCSRSVSISGATV